MFISLTRWSESTEHGRDKVILTQEWHWMLVGYPLFVSLAHPKARPPWTRPNFLKCFVWLHANLVSWKGCVETTVYTVVQGAQRLTCSWYSSPPPLRNISIWGWVSWNVFSATCCISFTPFGPLMGRPLVVTNLTAGRMRVLTPSQNGSAEAARQYSQKKCSGCDSEVIPKQSECCHAPQFSPCKTFTSGRMILRSILQWGRPETTVRHKIGPYNWDIIIQTKLMRKGLKMLLIACRSFQLNRGSFTNFYAFSWIPASLRMRGPCEDWGILLLKLWGRGDLPHTESWDPCHSCVHRHT